MEIFLAIVVASAVILFGALISMGNERQRRAIDNLREQIVLWAMQDLKIKCEHLTRNVEVSDPLGWFNQTASKAINHELQLQLLEETQQPISLWFFDAKNNQNIVFCKDSPQVIRNILSKRKNNILNDTHYRHLLHKLAKSKTIELSNLNMGFMFSTELHQAWSKICNVGLSNTDRIWLYISTQEHHQE